METPMVFRHFLVVEWDELSFDIFHQGWGANGRLSFVIWDGGCLRSDEELHQGISCLV